MLGFNRLLPALASGRRCLNTTGEETGPVLLPSDINPSACVYTVAVHLKYDYDLLVVGGGSGGLACAKEGES